MGPLAIVAGLVLVADGVVSFALSYHPDGHAPFTALIPAAFGLVLVVLGFLARQDKLRMHVMHAAATVGLLGGGMAGFLVVQDLLKYSHDGAFARPTATVSKAVMAVTCLVFVALCVKSFVDARRRRQAAEAAASQP